jgi:hypothetical protein
VLFVNDLLNNSLKKQFDRLALLLKKFQRAKLKLFLDLPIEPPLIN